MPAELDDFLCEVQCEEFYGDPEEELDEEDMEEWSDYEDLPHDEDEDSVLIDENGGLTADGYETLAQLDAAGYFV